MGNDGKKKRNPVSHHVAKCQEINQYILGVASFHKNKTNVIKTTQGFKYLRVLELHNN